MSESPFSKPPIPVFSGIAGKIQMALTVKSIIDGKKDFIDSVKNAAKVKATQKANEILDKKIKEARERGETEADNLKKQRDEQKAAATSARATNASKTAALTSTPTTAVTSAKSVRSATANNPKIKKLQSEFDKLKADVAKARAEQETKTTEFNATLTRFNNQPPEATLAEVKSAQSKMQAAGVAARELSNRAADKGLELTNEQRKITG